MSRTIPLWRSPEISLHRFDHPAEHEDQPYEETAGSFRASFVERGTFDLEVGEGRWRVTPGDVMLAHPGMRYRAGFEGQGFSDTCLTLTYLAADDERFDHARTWSRAGRPILPASNRVRYLRWGLARAVETGAMMFAEYCASEIFREVPENASAESQLFSDRKFGWYAERVHAARERLEQKFDETHTTSDLARAAGMSMFHFTRVFAELVGRPPHRYLNEVRLRAARDMLRKGRSVTEACFACGYNNLSHFSRSFASRYGASPSRLAR
jgi:AraC family transcriptional regulator